MGSVTPPIRRKEVTRTVRPSIASQCLVTWDGPIGPLFGYSLADTNDTEEWWLEKIHPDDRNRVAEGLSQHMLPRPEKPFAKDSRIWGADYRFRHINGEYVLVADRAITTRDVEGSFISLVSVIFEKETRRREREAHARAIQSQNNLALIANNTPSALYMMDPQGYCIYMNSAAEQITGFQFQEIYDYTFHASCHSCKPNGEPYPLQECPVFRHSQDGTAAKNESEIFVHKDGHYYNIEYSVSPIGKYGSGGAVIEFRDVTEQKKIERERINAILTTEQQSARIKADEVHKANMTSFVSFVCHELRNPLQGVTSSAEFLLETLGKLDEMSKRLSVRAASAAIDGLVLDATSSPRRPPSPQADPPTFAEMTNLLSSARQLVGNIQTCADHQALIINNVLDLSRLDAGKVEPLYEVMEVQALGQQVVMMMSAKAQGKSIRLSKTEAELLYLKVDATMLRQVLLNLVSNAIKFTPERGSIVVDLHAEPPKGREQIVLHGSVTDNGLGMSEAEQQKLFQRFSQANRKVAQLYGGSGLGLSISKELVRVLGGEMHVQSLPGKGSTFSFTSVHDIPTKDELVRFLSKEGHSSVPGEPEHTLQASLITPASKFKVIGVAEDNPINLQYLAKNLRALGYKYVLATNGKEILEQFCRLDSIIDCCILDMSMPVMDGLEAARRIREHEADQKLLRRTPIIALSGNALKEQVSDALSAGISDYLIKPCKQATLARTLQYWEQIIHTGAEHVPLLT